ncbi:MAG: hypothetical protein R2860_09940 [Desulfobacterales bacterium]
MFQRVAQEITGAMDFDYQGETDLLQRGFRQRLPLLDSLEQIAGVDPALFTRREALIEFATSKGIAFGARDMETIGIGKILTKIFDALVEPRLIQPDVYHRISGGGVAPVPTE